MTIDWHYHRQNCETCARAAAYLAEHGIKPLETVNARKTSIDPAAATELLRQCRRLFVTRGPKVYEFDLTQPFDVAEVNALILGRTGSLRAPVVRAGGSLVVGFLPELYDRVLSNG